MSSRRLQNSESYKRSQRMFLLEEVTFKTVEKDRRIQKIKDDLRSVISFIDWIHSSNKFIESNEGAIKQIEGVQNYKLSELMGGKLQHALKKMFHNFSSFSITKEIKI